MLVVKLLKLLMVTKHLRNYGATASEAIGCSG